jgi:hypothetical protein
MAGQVSTFLPRDMARDSVFSVLITFTQSGVVPPQSKGLFFCLFAIHAKSISNQFNSVALMKFLLFGVGFSLPRNE